MDRRDKTNYYLDMAQVALERGTCLRRNFGAVIVKNDVIVSTGLQRCAERSPTASTSAPAFVRRWALRAAKDTNSAARCMRR